MTIIQETLKLKRSYPFPHGMGQVEMDLTGSSGAAGSGSRQSWNTSSEGHSTTSPLKCYLFTAPFIIQDTPSSPNHLSILCILPIVSTLLYSSCKNFLPNKSHPSKNEVTKKTVQRGSTLEVIPFSILPLPAGSCYEMLLLLDQVCDSLVF